MKLVYLELDFNDYLINLTFDKLDSMAIDETLNVCTTETVRGKNKTFNAYLKPIGFTISGKFSDHVSNNIEIVRRDKTIVGDTYVYHDVTVINSLVGKDKSAKLNDLFDSMIEDTRLLNIKTFYKTYDNYIINNFNLVYLNNNTISVDLTLQEVLLRDLNEYTSIPVPYQLIEKIKREQVIAVVEKVVDIVASLVDTVANFFGSLKKSFIRASEETESQGGHYE